MKCPFKQLKGEFIKERREHPTLPKSAVWTIACDHYKMTRKKKQ